MAMLNNQRANEYLIGNIIYTYYKQWIIPLQFNNRTYFPIFQILYYIFPYFPILLSSINIINIILLIFSPYFIAFPSRSPLAFRCIAPPLRSASGPDIGSTRHSHSPILDSTPVLTDEMKKSWE